jgi:hypothetical protein
LSGREKKQNLDDSGAVNDCVADPGLRGKADCPIKLLVIVLVGKSQSNVIVRK